MLWNSTLFQEVVFEPRPGRVWRRIIRGPLVSRPPSPASLQDWSSNPMFERKDNKKDALLDLDGRMATLNKRYTVVKDAGLKIQAMVAVRSRPGAPGGTGGRGLEVPKNASPAAADHPGRALRGWIPHAVSAVCVRGVIAPCPAHDGCAQGHHPLRVQRSSSPGETPLEGEGRVRG